jgi:Outer membrane protein beta-barrel family
MRYFLLLVLCLPLCVAAQTVPTITVKGRIKNAAGAPVELATVMLIEQRDSTRRQLTYSAEDGQFEFLDVQRIPQVLAVTYLGSEPYSAPVALTGYSDPVFVMPDVVLQPAAVQLNGVTISAKTPFVERKIDRTIVNVDAMVGTGGTNALEILERAPGVTVDQDGLIKLKGRSGVVIYVDDKPTYLSGTELDNYLKSLPVGVVKQIEIMPNPPAKYEAAGGAGVINIVTRRSRLTGLYGNLNTTLQRGRYTRNNNSLNINYNRNRIGITANLNAGVRESFQDLNINRYYLSQQSELQSSFSQNSFIEKFGRSLSGKLGLDVYATDRTTFGVSVKALGSLNGANTDNTAFIRDANRTELQRVLADNEDRRNFNNATYNAYLKQNIGSKGASITLDADYVTYWSDAEQLFRNTSYAPDGQLVFENRINGALPSDIDIYAVKTDATWPLQDGSKFDAGLKTAFTATDNTADYRTTVGGVTEPDYNLSNEFLYDEWIHSAYFNYSRGWKQVDLQVGLRAEATQLEGNQLGNPQRPDSSFTRDYANLFPTVFVQWRADTIGRHTWSFSFGRRINRPFFQDLNPFISPLDRFTFYGGNPNLLPTYAYNASLSHSLNGWLNTSLNYGLTTDGIYETLEIVNEIYYSRPGNIATDQSASISIEASKPITAWYTLNAYAEGGYLWYDSPLYTETLNAGGPYYNCAATNVFQLGKGWAAEVRGDYNSNVVYAQLLIKSWGTLNCAVQKKVFNRKGTLKLSFNDILYTRRADGIINNLRDTEADWDSRLDTRSVTLAFSYGFGKAKTNKPKHNSSGSETEQQRVKT